METANQIHDRMMTHVSQEYDRRTGSFIWDATKAAAKEFEQQQIRTEGVADKLNVDKLTGGELEQFVYQRTGLFRKPSTYAYTTVVISGSQGSSISKGDMVSSDTVTFTSLEDRTIESSGQMTVFVISEVPGSAGNVPAGAINRFPVSLPGLVDVYNPEAVTNGYDAETDNQLRARYYDKLQRPGKAGNKYHYEEWAMEVLGVGDVRVFPRFNGPLTVKVVIIDSNKQPADLLLIDRVYSHIEEEMPFGVSELSVVSATPKKIDVSAELTLADGYILENVQTEVEQNIRAYLSEIAFKQNFVSYARLGNAILDTEGVIDYNNLLVNGVSANVQVTDEEIAVSGTIDITEGGAAGA